VSSYNVEGAGVVYITGDYELVDIENSRAVCVCMVTINEEVGLVWFVFALYCAICIGRNTCLVINASNIII